MLLMALILMSCSKGESRPERDTAPVYGTVLTHDMIVLGDRLENPYKKENVETALMSLYPTKADRIQLKATDLYVRFLPVSEEEYDLLTESGITLIDHPLDYDILVEGDWYHDPEIPDEAITWQYAVVPSDFEFPDVLYEIIDECYISEHDIHTKAYDVDWEEVEREAYILTGNEDMLDERATRASSKVKPSGRITIVDKDANGGKAFGLAGVCVSCNSFVKFSESYTDRDGYYTMPKTFNSSVRYRLIFKNVKGFSIGLNLVLVPASVSTLGKASSEGINVTITEDSDDKLFRRCVVNNAAYDYYSRCSSDDMGINPPPADLRIWIFHNLKSSSAVMLHHGALIQNSLVKSYLGAYYLLLELFVPDITLGLADRNDYKRIYSCVCHELAHASHFTKAGKEFWTEYIKYIMVSYAKTGGMTYGDGTGDGAGYCSVGEMWGYYLESKMYQERYGGAFPTFGSSFWFRPQILRNLDERGFECSEIFSVLDSTVNSDEALKAALIMNYPSKSKIVEQVFSRY